MMRSSKGAVAVPEEFSTSAAATSPSTSIDQFKFGGSLLVAAPKEGAWTKEQLESMREQGMQEISERRFWHKAYMANFPNPLPHHQGHQPAVLQSAGLAPHLLLAEDNPATVPRAAFMSREEVNRRNADWDWAGKRDQLLAMTAAGVHGVNFLVHYMNLQWRYLDHKYAPQHEHIYSQFGNW